jgi:hypothetical protein
MSQRSQDEDVVAAPGNRTVPRGLDGLLGTAPTFSGALRGYDRLQVDDYVAWAEAEIDLARRAADHLLSRYAACCADLQGARRRLGEVARDRETDGVRERARDVLARAAREAEARTAVTLAHALREAERIAAEAQADAQARLAKVEAIRAAAVAERDTARIEARGLRQQATATLAAAREEAARTLAAVQAEVEDLRRQREDARLLLHRLTGQLEDVLNSVPADVPGELVVVADDRRSVAS